MTISPFARRSWFRARRWLACSIALTGCLRATTAAAEERLWAAVRVAPNDETQPVDLVTVADDPDLVRAGVHPTLGGALAAGVRVEHFATVDVDGDGRDDALLVVTPSRDPYPYNRAPGLVVACAVDGGWRALVVARRAQPERAADDRADAYEWLAPVTGGRETALVLLDRRNESHDPSDYFIDRHVFLRVDGEGRAWWLGTTLYADFWQAGCGLRRYRWAGERRVRGDGRGCPVVTLEAADAEEP